jgi:hypothetical protein
MIDPGALLKGAFRALQLEMSYNSGFFLTATVQEAPHKPHD